MRIVTVTIAHSVEDCWRAFVDLASLLRWVPGLHDARLLATDDEGRPRDIRFRFAGGLEYTLRYSYDRSSGLVQWEPLEDAPGVRIGVRGYACFREVEGGTEVEYALDHEPDRKAAERALDHPQLLVDAFARFMHEA